MWCNEWWIGSEKGRRLKPGVGISLGLSKNIKGVDRFFVSIRRTNRYLQYVYCGGILDITHEYLEKKLAIII